MVTVMVLNSAYTVPLHLVGKVGVWGNLSHGGGSGARIAWYRGGTTLNFNAGGGTVVGASIMNQSRTLTAFSTSRLNNASTQRHQMGKLRGRVPLLKLNLPLLSTLPWSPIVAHDLALAVLRLK